MHAVSMKSWYDQVDSDFDTLCRLWAEDWPWNPPQDLPKYHGAQAAWNRLEVAHKRSAPVTIFPVYDPEEDLRAIFDAMKRAAAGSL